MQLNLCTVKWARVPRGQEWLNRHDPKCQVEGVAPPPTILLLSKLD